MADRLCKECIHFARKDRKEYGECRRYPPTLGGTSSAGIWPVVKPASWCGEFASKAAEAAKAAAKPKADQPDRPLEME